jgi:nicotinamide mononucleotide transporter
MHEFLQQFVQDIRNTSLLEYIAVVTGIASVWFSKKENILVYPIGLINTIIYVYLSIKIHLYGEASVNLYYTVVSIYGWIIWSRRNDQRQHVLRVTYSSTRLKWQQVLFFAFFYVIIYFSLTYLKKVFSANTIPWADAFASASAYTGMWLMARKKVESWFWWIATNIASVPLYFLKHFSLTSVYYLILLFLAFAGLSEWKRRASEQKID